jgi:hypothetical protein
VNNPSPGITPALSINFSDFYFRVGFTPGAYDVYGWVKDRAGNISSLSASGSGTASTDKASITYQPGTPPVITDVLATSSDTPSTPPDSTDLSAPTGSSVYIRWKATDDQAFPATPISLYYTTDDATYTLIANNIANSANTGCTLSGTDTGCYKWTNGSPTNSYLRIRVTARDSNSMESFAVATPLNVMPPIQFIAGNTEAGLNGSANSAMFFNELSQNTVTDPHSLVVTPEGTIYFRDIRRGILVVSPTDGIQKIFIPTTGTASGDGGPVTSATLRLPVKIALDYQNRLLIYDYDRIRRVNTAVNPMTISTIIGGGALTADGTAPLSLQISALTSYANANIAYSPFFALPNGDIYFQSDGWGQKPSTGFRIRVYKSALNQIQSVYVSGTGDNYNAAQDITQCFVMGSCF